MRLAQRFGCRTIVTGGRGPVGLKGSELKAGMAGFVEKMKPHLAIAFSPYHLPREEKLLGELIKALGDSIAVFYAWQHGMGCHKKLPKEQELLQLPGRGELDFAPLLSALKHVRYAGWTEIFMHPVPRGVPILETAAEVTREINRSRAYLERRLAQI